MGMLRLSIKTLALVMLTISGCTAFSKLSNEYNEKIPNVHIAYAHFIEDVESSERKIYKKYQLDEICEGRFLTDDCVYVVIKKRTIPKEGLPVQAILILHYKSELLWYDEAIERISKLNENEFLLRDYVPLQNDARKGILPDTPENRQIIESLSLEKLSRTPIEDQITMEQAIEIAKVSCEYREDYIYEYSARRYPYGWEAGCLKRKSSGAYMPGGLSIVFVGDDGEVKEVIGGF
jgi:hypothetical protein